MQRSSDNIGTLAAALAKARRSRSPEAMIDRLRITSKFRLSVPLVGR
jgi:hypothetical protein